MHRRTILKATLGLAALGLPDLEALAAVQPAQGAGRPFAFDRLKARARAMASRPYRSPVETLPPALAKLAPLDYQRIHNRRDDALWAGDADVGVRIHYFHTGMQFDVPVHLHVVDPHTQRAHEIPFNPALFDYDDSGVDPQALAGKHLGFAGFRISIDPQAKVIQEVAAFLGASYFRAIDRNRQYGLSARGLAIDTDVSSGEEFPDFIDFWFVRPETDAERVTVYALLDSPSVAGAYRFDIDCSLKKGVVMHVTMELHARAAIKRLGIAPMSSMFLKGSSQPEARDTIYPQMHDSDRLTMWRGNGEWVCRPLFNPPTIQYNAFADHNPRGFGLVQHDHDFNDYRDTVAWYSRRPSLWIEPKGDWGKGEIALLEMPTVGETVDNIAAFWIPNKPVTAGDQLDYAYTLYWYPEPPVKPGLAQVDKTWSGMGNVPQGWIPGNRSPEHYARRFAIDFVGPPLDTLADDADVSAQISLSRGKLGLVNVHRMAPIHGWRAVFDWIPESDSVAPVTFRLYLKQGDRTLSETWLYQWVPPHPDARHY